MASIIAGVVMYSTLGISAHMPIPITTPFAILTPAKQIILQTKSSAVVFQIDTINYWNALSNLASVHKNLTSNMNILELTPAEWPQITSLANHT